MNLEAVRANAAAAATEDLLDRVTVFRAGMEEEALEVLELQLRSRGVTEAQIQAHAEERGREVLWQRPGLAWSCSFCDKPAVAETWRWRKIFWNMVALYPCHIRCCREHLDE